MIDKKKTAWLLGGLFIWLSHTVTAQNLPANERQRLAREIEQYFTQYLLAPFFPRVIDREKGGFLTSFEYDWKPSGSQDKMIVSQSRHTWLPAKTLQMYPNQPHMQEAARHGFAFLRDVMWDSVYGGFYTTVTRDGQPKNDLKTAYGNAFGIYALSAYYQTFGDTAALNLAKKAFFWLEKHSHDPNKKGYFQNLQRDGSLARQDTRGNVNPELMYKDQNSSIHLLEALAELYSVWPDPLVRERLQEMLVLIRDTIVTERGNLTLFLTADWKPISYRDSTEAQRKAHYVIDHVSPGHDIETAYLLLEAAHVLGLGHDKRTEEVTKRMVDHTLQTGWDTSIGGFFERGYYFKGENKMTVIDNRKNWWAQAEGLNTLLLMSDKYPNDPMKYAEKFQKQWQYMQRYLIDTTYGGWYPGGLDKEPHSNRERKGHQWKAAYHEGRSLMNCLQRLRPDTKAPTAPAQLSLDREKRTLQWKAASDDRKVLGYRIYRGDQLIGYTPLLSFTLPANQLSKDSAFKVTALDAQGNQSSATSVRF
jgi:mannobiose 2-epimerase